MSKNLPYASSWPQGLLDRFDTFIKKLKADINSPSQYLEKPGTNYCPGHYFQGKLICHLAYKYEKFHARDQITAKHAKTNKKE